MNYFEIFDLPVQLTIDKNLLKKKYLELSRRFHPDYFIQQSSEAQQQALEQSAQVNKAFKTFSNQDETIKYVLELKGLLVENEKYNLPSDFLMEMMTLNEAVAEARFDVAAKERTMQDVLVLEEEQYLPVKAIVEQYIEGAISDTELLRVKAYYFKKKYTERLKHQLNEKL